MHRNCYRQLGQLLARPLKPGEANLSGCKLEQEGCDGFQQSPPFDCCFLSMKKRGKHTESGSQATSWTTTPERRWWVLSKGSPPLEQSPGRGEKWGTCTGQLPGNFWSMYWIPCVPFHWSQKIFPRQRNVQVECRQSSERSQGSESRRNIQTDRKLQMLQRRKWLTCSRKIPLARTQSCMACPWSQGDLTEEHETKL